MNLNVKYEPFADVGCLDLSSTQLKFAAAHWQFDDMQDGCILERSGRLRFVTVEGIHFSDGFFTAASRFAEGVLIADIIRAEETPEDVISISPEADLELLNEVEEVEKNFFDDGDELEPV